MLFLVSIELGNDAMQSREHVKRALDLALNQPSSDWATMIRTLEPGETAPIFDGNGNSVGSWRVARDDES